MLGLGLSIPRCAVRAGDALTREIASILAKYGTDAHVYLPGIGVINGLTAGNYLDSAGTTAATVDNPVGLVLDAAGSVGSEIKSIGTLAQRGVSTASTYDTTTGVGSVSRVNSTNQSSVVFACNANSTYRITVTNSTANLLNIRDGSDIGTLLQQVPANTTATYHLKFSLTSIAIAAASDGVTVNFTISSIKEVTGIHATQATTANKPILRRGAVNLLQYSQEFDNGYWTKQLGTVSAANSEIAPDGTLTADTFTATSANANLYRSQSGITASYNFSIWIKRKTGTGAVSLKVGATTTVVSVTAEWQRFNTTGVNNNFPGIQLATSGDEVYIWGAQLETGSTASPYIPTTTAAASSPTGNYHWVHDSTDVLTATFPAGYESATIIDTPKSGQSTLTAQNIVGTYNIGPSIDTYGRFVFKTIEASELAIVQSYCNRLAGV